MKILNTLREGEVARFKDLRGVVRSPRTLSLKLKEMIKLEVVEATPAGYRITAKGLKALEFMEELLKPKLEIKGYERIPHLYYAPLIKRYCEILYELFNGNLLSLVLFGSIARGDWSKDSDIDLLVVAEHWERVPVWGRIRELRKAKDALESSPDYMRALKAGYWPIIQHYPLSVNEALRFNRIYVDASIDGILLYDRNGFMEKAMQVMRKRLEELGAVRVMLPNRKFYWIFGELSAGRVIELG